MDVLKILYAQLTLSVKCYPLKIIFFKTQIASEWKYRRTLTYTHFTSLHILNSGMIIKTHLSVGYFALKTGSYLILFSGVIYVSLTVVFYIYLIYTFIQAII